MSYASTMEVNYTYESGKWCGGCARYPTADEFRAAVAEHEGVPLEAVGEVHKDWLRWDVGPNDCGDSGGYVHTGHAGRGCTPVWVVDKVAREEG